MRRIVSFIFVLLFLGISIVIVLHFWQKEEITFYSANDERISYVGRFDFSLETYPKAWAPGSYLEFESQGTSCEIVIEDEVKFGNTHNYLEIVLDHGKTKRIKLQSRFNRIQLFKDASGGRHHILVCKNTESAIGFIKIKGIYCQKLCKWRKPQKPLFEFIGDSITCGNGADQSKIPFGKGSWYDYHNAYLSFGARLARVRNADWILSSVSGIGMNKSCCGLKSTMPNIYDYIDFHSDYKKWSFDKKPDVVFVTLGQNDGGNEMTNYERKYKLFLSDLRKKYPKSWIICCSSPMASLDLKQKMKQSIQKVVSWCQQKGDKLITSFHFQGIYCGGYDKHPTVEQHWLMMNELESFLDVQHI